MLCLPLQLASRRSLTWVLALQQCPAVAYGDHVASAHCCLPGAFAQGAIYSHSPRLPSGAFVPLSWTRCPARGFPQPPSSCRRPVSVLPRVFLSIPAPCTLTIRGCQSPVMAAAFGLISLSLQVTNITSDATFILLVSVAIFGACSLSSNSQSQVSCSTQQ